MTYLFCRPRRSEAISTTRHAALALAMLFTSFAVINASTSSVSAQSWPWSEFSSDARTKAKKVAPKRTVPRKARSTRKKSRRAARPAAGPAGNTQARAPNLDATVDFTVAFWRSGDLPLPEAFVLQRNLDAIGCILPNKAKDEHIDGKWGPGSHSTFMDFLQQTGRSRADVKSQPLQTIVGWVNDTVVGKSDDVAEKTCPPLARKLVLSVTLQPDAQVGQPFEQLASVAGGKGALSFTHTGKLPDGTRLDAATGTVKGTPLSPGSFNYTIVALSEGAPKQVVEHRVSGTIAPPPAKPLKLSVAASAKRRVGEDYRQTTTVSGGTPPVAFKVVGSLPPGLTLNANGTVSGKPETVGGFTYAIEVTDSGAKPQIKQIEVDVEIKAERSPKVAKLDLNDVSILFDVPRSADDLKKVISMGELKEAMHPVLKTPVETDIWPVAVFQQFKALSNGPAGSVKNGGQILLPGINPNDKEFKKLPGKEQSKLLVADREKWFIAGIRVDPGAPGISKNIQREFGRQPQIRLIVQPVELEKSKEPDGSETVKFKKVNDVAAHLIFSFQRGRGKERTGCSLRWFEADDVAFREIVDELKMLKARFNPKGDSGVLDVHPSAGSAEFKTAVQTFLGKHLHPARLAAMAVMGLNNNQFEPWIFMAMQRNSPTNLTFEAVPSPGLNGPAKAQMLVIDSFPERTLDVKPAPSTNNESDATCEFNIAAGVEGHLKTRKGTSTAELLRTAKIPVRDEQAAKESLRRIADPEESHFFNTDCVSCHTETRKPLEIGLKQEKDFDKIAASRLPKSFWNVRNFGWGLNVDPDKFDATQTKFDPTITQRTLTETEEVAHYINSCYFGDPKPDICKDEPFPVEKVVKPKPKPTPPATGGTLKPQKIRWLDQGWSDQQRAWFHHASQGTSTLIMPYSWFINLEQSGGKPGARFQAPEFLAKFGFLSSPVTADNKDGLPVGFARTSSYPSPTSGEKLPDQIGFTCAACHTGELSYGGRQLRFDGGAAMIDLAGFQGAMVKALEATATEDGRFARFADKVLPVSAGPDGRKVLRKQMKGLVAGMKIVWLADNAATGLKAILKKDKPHILEGFGRLDALNRIGNQVFWSDLLSAGDFSLRRIMQALPAASKQHSPADRVEAFKTFVEAGLKALKAGEKRKKTLGFDVYDNLHPRNAPVSFPPIWTVPWNLWAQYDGSILQPLVRNAGEALGVGAKVNLTNTNAAQPLFKSSIDMRQLHKIEELLAGSDPWKGAKKGFKGLQAPRWVDAAAAFPGDSDWLLDPAKVAHGRNLYAELCVNCHLPPIRDPQYGSAKPVNNARVRDLWDENEAQSWTWLKGLSGCRKKLWCEINGKRYLNVRMFKTKAIGTDSATAKILSQRTVTLPKYVEITAKDGLCGAAKTLAGNSKVPFGPALMVVVQRTIDQWFEDNDVPVADRKRLLGNRENCPNPVDSVYRARTLEGMWATAPFLHNGSVPTLWSLLSPDPDNDRPKQFCVGSKVFDPEKVGFKVSTCTTGTGIGTDKGCACEAGTTPLDTSIPGNHNTGHVFTNDGTVTGRIGRALKQDERWALIEYLKSL